MKWIKKLSEIFQSEFSRKPISCQSPVISVLSTYTNTCSRMQKGIEGKGT